MKFLYIIFFITAIAFRVDAATNNNLEIIDGTLILPHWAPYLVFLSINGSMDLRCGGTLVSENYVLTAAQCLKYSETVQVILGADNLSNTTDDARITFDIEPDQFKIHELFDEDTLENDIGLIKLPNAVTANNNIKTIPVAQEEDVENLVGKMTTAIGWGAIHDDPIIYDDVPFAIWIVVMENYDSECSERFGDQIQDTNICATHKNSWDGPNLNLCDGDFGGPLVLNYSLLVGVASFAGNSCIAEFPNVFTDVSKYTGWLLANSDVNFN